MRSTLNSIPPHIGKNSLVIAALAVISSCGGGNAPTPPNGTYTLFEGAEIIVFDSHMVNCSYMGFALVLQGCLPYQRDKSRLASASKIGDLDLEWGYTYEIDVSFWRAKNEIADGPQVVMSLERLISKTPDPVGEIYTFLDQRPKFTFNQGGQFLNYSYVCALEEGCSWLSADLESNVDLTFQLGENREFILIDAQTVILP